MAKRLPNLKELNTLRLVNVKEIHRGKFTSHPTKGGEQQTIHRVW